MPSSFLIVNDETHAILIHSSWKEHCVYLDKRFFLYVIPNDYMQLHSAALLYQVVCWILNHVLVSPYPHSFSMGNDGQASQKLHAIISGSREFVTINGSVKWQCLLRNLVASLPFLVIEWGAEIRLIHCFNSLKHLLFSGSGFVAAFFVCILHVHVRFPAPKDDKRQRHGDGPVHPKARWKRRSAVWWRGKIKHWRAEYGLLHVSQDLPIFNFSCLKWEAI